MDEVYGLLLSDIRALAEATGLGRKVAEVFRVSFECPYPSGLLASSNAIATGVIHRPISSISTEQHAYLAIALEIMGKYSLQLLMGLFSAKQKKLLTLCSTCYPLSRSLFGATFLSCMMPEICFFERV